MTNTSSRSGAGVAVAMLAAVCGSVLSALITIAIGESPATSLVAAAGGAAFGALVGTAGRFHGLRIGAGIAVTVLALGITYGGFTLVYTVSGRSTPFMPVPSVGGDSSLDSCHRLVILEVCW
ncbi:hypothetical protein [Actinomadura decatromicini]|uniref:Uncharacterized protein n=1 Tax=Actinomadura decatromicini TaxID=2604572 RepID=A0A5D3F730_9ACTN|nr:hypothetical protein [Actinomadura decatromicini]TYK43942.1 hypothetical protein FXF68_35000 [Actinomadura decatromicini]